MSKKRRATTKDSHFLPCPNGRTEDGERTKMHLPAAQGPKKRQKQQHSERRKAHADSATSITKSRGSNHSIYKTQEATQRHAAGVGNTRSSPPRKRHRTSYADGEAANILASAAVSSKIEVKKTREESPRWSDISVASAVLQKHLEALGRGIPTSSSSRETRDIGSHQRQPLLQAKKEKQQQQKRHQGAQASQLERQQQQQHERHTQQMQEHSEQKQPLTQHQREQQRPEQMQQSLQQQIWPHHGKRQRQQPGKERQQRSEQRQQQPSKQLQQEEHREAEQQEQWQKNPIKKQQKQPGQAKEEGRSGRQQQHVDAKLRQQQQQSGRRQQWEKQQQEKQQRPEEKGTPQQQTAAMKQQGRKKKQGEEAQPSQRQQRQQQGAPQEFQWGRRDTGEKRDGEGASGAPRQPSAAPAAVAVPSLLQQRRPKAQQQQQWQTGGAGRETDAAVAAAAPQQQQWRQRQRESEPAFLTGKRRREQQLQDYEEQGLSGGEAEKNSCRGKKELLQRLQERLKGSRFRSLNEQLYTTTGGAALAAFQQNPDLFKVYHEGYRQQVKQWPLNPLRLIKDWVNTLPHTLTIGDFGCGEAALAEAFPNRKIYSYDLVAATPAVVACNLADLPVASEFFDVGIFCLSLMGTDWPAFLREAYRVLKNGGRLKIAEVASRFVDCEAFMEAVEALGFTRATPAMVHVASFFVVFEFRKESKHDEPRCRTATGNLEGHLNKGKHRHARKKHKSQRPRQLVSSLLKPCIYKRRG